VVFLRLSSSLALNNASLYIYAAFFFALLLADSFGLVFFIFVIISPFHF
jgi:hypothetical protein